MAERTGQRPAHQTPLPLSQVRQEPVEHLRQDPVECRIALHMANLSPPRRRLKLVPRGTLSTVRYFEATANQLATPSMPPKSAKVKAMSSSVGGRFLSSGWAFHSAKYSIG
jgi:hypothetical protein